MPELPHVQKISVPEATTRQWARHFNSRLRMYLKTRPTNWPLEPCQDLCVLASKEHHLSSH